MKNKLFGKATALVMGSLVLFSSQALAISSNNNQELSSADASSESELIVAQDVPIEAQEKIALAEAISKAVTTVGDAAAVANAASYPNAADKIAVAQSFAEATSVVGDALASANADTVSKGDAAAISQSLAKAQTVVGDAAAFASSKASSEDGPAIAQAGARAESTVGDAISVADAAAS